jgi:hypothetical protein
MPHFPPMMLTDESMKTSDLPRSYVLIIAKSVQVRFLGSIFKQVLRREVITKDGRTGTQGGLLLLKVVPDGVRPDVVFWPDVVKRIHFRKGTNVLVDEGGSDDFLPWTHYLDTMVTVHVKDTLSGSLSGDTMQELLRCDPGSQHGKFIWIDGNSGMAPDCMRAVGAVL